MMKKYKRLLALGMAAMLVLGGCSNNGNSSNNSNTSSGNDGGEAVHPPTFKSVEPPAVAPIS